MKFSLAIVAIAVGVVSAIPTGGNDKPGKGGDKPECPGTPGTPGKPPGAYDACPDGLYANLQCCSTDVLGVADLDCKNPAAAPASAAAFKAGCASGGQRARCCAIPVANQAVLCVGAIGAE